MSPLRLTPDGRIITYGDDAADEPPTQRDTPLRRLQPFFNACLTVLPDGPLTDNARIGILLFMLGAADRYWYRLDLDDTRFPAFAESLLQMQGLAPAEAATLASTLPQLRDQPNAREALLEGAETLEHWLDGHDSNSVLRLQQLVVQWQDMSGPLVYTGVNTG